MRGLVPHDRVCEMRSGAVLWRRAWPVGAAHSVLSGRSSRRCAGALSSPSRWGWRLLHRRERPAVSGELARDGDHDDRARLASGLERVPASVQPAGAPVGLGSHGERLAGASAFERDAQARTALRWCQAASTRSRRACVLPVLVIPPCRRRSPLEFSLGVRPRNGPSDSGRNRFQSPSSTVNANAVSVETPRRQTSRSTTSTYGGSRRARRSPCRARPSWSSRRASGRSTRRTRSRAARFGTAAGEATRRGLASTRSRRTPPRGAAAASRAGAGPASDRRGRPHAHGRDHARPPLPARAPAPG